MRSIETLEGLVHDEAALHMCVDLNVMAPSHHAPHASTEDAQIEGHFKPNFLRRAGSKDLLVVDTVPLPALAVLSIAWCHLSSRFPQILFQTGVSASHSPRSIFS
jgi:hypothetical protein